MSGQVSKQQLQTLLVEFYQKHDPTKLEYGVDIAGIVQWTLNNSIDDLQHLLAQSYGEGLDLSKKESKQSAMHHMSTALPKNGFNLADQQRNELLLKIHDFYSVYSPDKLENGLDKFVDFALYHGLPALNKKLVAKYGVGISEGPYVPPRKKNQAPELPKRVSPPPEPVFDVNVDDLRTRLQAFYQKHDPEKAYDLDQIVEWGASIGLDSLDMKLMQIYGEGLYDFEVAGLAPPPPVDFDEPPAPAVAPPAAPARLQSSSPKPPPPQPRPKPPRPAARAPSEREAAPSSAPVSNTVRHWATPGASDHRAPVAASGVKGGSSGDGPCDNYRLDMTGTTFGVCQCGFSRMEHQKANRRSVNPKAAGPIFPKSYSASTAKPLAPAARKPSKPPTPASRKPSKPPTPVNRKPSKPPAPKPATRSAAGKPKATSDQGPCTSYHLDMSGLRYGDCTCGYSRADHQPAQRAKIIEMIQFKKENAPKEADAEPIPEVEVETVEAETPASTKSGPCNQYRLDMVNGAYGDCVCGYSRADHASGKVVSRKPSAAVSRQPSTPISRQPSTPISRQPSTPISRQPSTPISRQQSSLSTKASNLVQGVKRLSQKLMGQSNADLREQLAMLKRQEEEVKRQLALTAKLEALRAEEERIQQLLENGEYDPMVHEQGLGEHSTEMQDAVNYLETDNPHFNSDCYDHV